MPKITKDHKTAWRKKITDLRHALETEEMSFKEGKAREEEINILEGLLDDHDEFEGSKPENKKPEPKPQPKKKPGFF